MKRVVVLASVALASIAGAHPMADFPTTAEPVNRDGIRAVCDLPASEHLRNRGGNDRTRENPRGEPGKGLGLCVFTSVELAARWQGVQELLGFQEWMTQRPGGGYPEKLDRMILAFCTERKQARPCYVQHIGGDEAFLALALKTDRMPCVTYAGRDGFYKDAAGRDTWIDHMVNLAHLDDRTAAIIDNNRPGVWVWMSRQDFLLRWRARGNGWAVVLLDPPPPPHLPSSRPPAEPLTTASPPVQRPLGSPGCRDSLTPGSCSRESGQWVPAVGGGEWGYWQQGRCVARCFADGRCEAVDERGFATGVPIDPPAPLPPGVAASPPPRIDPYPNFGIDRTRLEETVSYSICGVEVTREEAHAALTGGALVDDSDRWHLTAVGDEAFLGRVRADVAALPSDGRARLHVQTYSPQNWAVAHFQLPRGVSLRKPSPIRTAEQVGTIAPEDYTAARLADLLKWVVIDPPSPPPQPVPPAPVLPSPPPANSPVPPALDVPASPLLALVVSAVLLIVGQFRRTR
jgi:hypothetical protein